MNKTVKINEQKKALYIDLFAGCGGLSLGLHKAGWNGFFAVEKNHDAFSTLKENLIANKNHFNWPEWLNCSTIDIYDLIKNYSNNLKKLNGKIDLVVGGPPCQGFSLAGKRNQDDDRNKLINAYIEFIEIVKPKMLFLENVHGFTVGFENNNKRGVPYSIQVVEKLEKLGYKTASKVIDVSAFGVPQKRKRFILFGTLIGDPNSFFEKLYFNREKFLKDRELVVPVSIQQAISDLREQNGTYINEEFKNFKFGKYGRIESLYQKLMRTEVSSFPNVDSHRFANHREDTTKLFTEIMNKTDKITRITPKNNLGIELKKRGLTVLKPSSLCTTITSIPDDFIHYSEPRIMTVREMARIQSFPDWYVFLGKYTTGGELRKKDVPRYTQIANAVPPLFAEQVGIAIMEMLDFNSGGTV